MKGKCVALHLEWTAKYVNIINSLLKHKLIPLTPS